MSEISDFADSEHRVVNAALLSRYGRLVPIEPVEVELRLDRDTERLTSCPGLYWSERGCQFVVCKTPAGRYRGEFLYSDEEHYGTGREEYDSLEACVSTLLWLQADHEKERAGVRSGATGSELNQEYVGPLIV